LPHFDGGEIPQTVILRLFDSLPLGLVERWREELSHLNDSEREIHVRKRIERYLDLGKGSAWLKIPLIADIVEQAFMHFDAVRYNLAAWVIMPNHMHALLTPLAGWQLESILHSLKSFTSNKCNAALGRQGKFWQQESFDRYVRDERHYQNAITYIEMNPVKAGLCKAPEEWRWSSAYRRATRRAP